MVVVPPLNLTVPGAVRLVLASRLKLEEANSRVAPLATLKLPPPLLLPPAPKYREPAWTSTGPVLVNVTPVVDTTNCVVPVPCLTNDPLFVKVFVQIGRASCSEREWMALRGVICR